MFFILRIIGGLLIGVPVYYFANHKKGNIHFRKCIILIVIITSLLAFIPFENVFISFDSPEESYKYFNMTLPDVKFIVEGTNSDLVIGDKDGVDVPFIAPKNETGWKLGTGINTIPIVDKSIGTCFVSVYHAIGTEDYYLIIYNLVPGSLELSDSSNSEFLLFEEYNSDDSEIYTTYYTVLPYKDDRYQLYINGEEYYIF